MNKRFQRTGHRKKISKRRYPKGYDSLFEYELHQTKLAGCSHHPDKLDYVVPHTYEPDFVHPSNTKCLIETKGRFRDSAEARKYVEIAKCNPEYEIVFVFQNPLTPMPNARKRQDGTKLTHAEWAMKNGFKYYDPYNTPKKWRSV